MTTDATIAWDGSTYPYIPGEKLVIHPSVRLHAEADGEVDGITHEVLRHALWNINVDHGNMIMRVSGSPAAAYGHDFNPVLLDEMGDYIFNGPFLQYLSAGVHLGVKWTLENRSENPGIRPGDMFLTNDPWIGTDHQPDVVIMAPVFVDDRIFCWIGNSMHTWDLGGTAPGGFNPGAIDVYYEGVHTPPVRIVESGVIRRDIEEQFTRSSRMPQLVTLDIRAEIAGARAATEGVLRLVERYGAGAVKATMRKLQDDSEEAFLKKLATIPDGTWTEEGWLESAAPGDRGVYRNRVTLTKRGDRLIFTNYGSADQIGTLGATYVAWRGAVISMLVTQMLFDSMFVIEGALRHCEFRVDPGLVSCAIRPASVSGAPVVTLMNTIGIGGLVLSKMLGTSSDGGLRTEVQSCMGLLSGTLNALHGVDQRGRGYATMLQDVAGAALGAKDWSDGQDTGGWPWDLQSTMPNVETNELFYPMLYLWRKELPDSGGAGKYRGGNSGEFAFIPHKTNRIYMNTIASQLAIPGPGLFGGLPTSTSAFQHVKGSGILEALASGAPMPTDRDELGGEVTLIGAKAVDVALDPGDVWVHWWASASGYGDPLLRDPDAVATDIRAGRLTRQWAETGYGVVDGDEEATRALRRTRFAQRLGSEPEHRPQPTPKGFGGRRVSESLEISGDAMACRHCRTRLADADGNFKDGATAALADIRETNPHIADPSNYTDTSVKARNFYCPGCAVLLHCEVVVGEEIANWDLRIGSTDLNGTRQFGT